MVMIAMMMMIIIMITNIIPTWKRRESFDFGQTFQTLTHKLCRKKYLRSVTVREEFAQLDFITRGF